MLSKLDLQPKCQGHSRNQKTMTRGTQTCRSKKNLSRGSLSYWCEADASKIIYRHNKSNGAIMKH